MNIKPSAFKEWLNSCNENPEEHKLVNLNQLKKVVDSQNERIRLLKYICDQQELVIFKLKDRMDLLEKQMKIISPITLETETDPNRKK